MASPAVAAELAENGGYMTRIKGRLLVRIRVAATGADKKDAEADGERQLADQGSILLERWSVVTDEGIWISTDH